MVENMFDNALHVPFLNMGPSHFFQCGVATFGIHAWFVERINFDCDSIFLHDD